MTSLKDMTSSQQPYQQLKARIEGVYIQRVKIFSLHNVFWKMVFVHEKLKTRKQEEEC